jgi:hypothetical protein
MSNYLTRLLILLISVVSLDATAQNYQSNVVFQGPKTLVLSAVGFNPPGKGTLPSGEPVSTGCDHGACFFSINYKGRNIRTNVSENLDNVKIYEYDFGGEGDKELVVQVEEKKYDRNDRSVGETTELFVYRYSKGMLQALFEKEIGQYKTIIKKDYIEFYMPSGLDTIWHYWDGSFYQMVPFQFPQRVPR